MEAIIATVLPYIPSAAIPIVVVVIAVAWIQSQRKEVAKKRDDFQTLTEYRISKLEENQSNLTESIKELQKSIVDLQISVNSLVIELKNLKEE